MELQWETGVGALDRAVARRAPGDVVVAAPRDRGFKYAPVAQAHLLDFLFTKANAHLFEVLCGQVRLYFDLEWREEVTGDEVAMRRAGGLRVRSFLTQCQLHFPATDRVVLVCGSRVVGGLYRHSYHVVFPDCYYGSTRSAGLAVAAFLHEAPPEVVELVDASVYTTRRCFRLPYQSKVGGVPLVPVVDFPVEACLVAPLEAQVRVVEVSPEPRWPTGFDAVPPDDPYRQSLELRLRVLGNNVAIAGFKVEEDTGFRLYVSAYPGSEVRRCIAAANTVHAHSRFVVRVSSTGRAAYMCERHSHFLYLGELEHEGQEDEMFLSDMAAAFEVLQPTPALKSLFYEVCDKERRMLFLDGSQAFSYGRLVDIAREVVGELGGALLDFMVGAGGRFRAAVAALALPRLPPLFQCFENAFALLQAERLELALSPTSLAVRRLLRPLALAQLEKTVYPETVLRPHALEPGAVKAVRAEMGMGKTFVETKFCELNPDLSVLTISCRVVLAKQKLERHQVPFRLYSDLRKEEFETVQHLALQYESLHRLKDRSRPFDVVFLDEVNTILHQSLASTNKGHCHENAEVFERLVLGATTVYAGDALLDGATFSILKSLRSDFTLDVYKRQPQPHEVKLIGKRKTFVERICLALLGGKKVFVGSASATFINKTLMPAVAQFVGLAADAFLVLTSASPARDFERDWGDAALRLVVVSPVNTVGYSYDGEDFDRVFGFASNGSCSVEHSLQQLRRVRNPRCRVFEVYLSKPARVRPEFLLPHFDTLLTAEAYIASRARANLSKMDEAWDELRAVTRVGFIDAWLRTGTPDTKFMPSWMLKNAAVLALKEFVYKAFPVHYLAYVLRERGVPLTLDDSDPVGLEAEHAVVEGVPWWDASDLITAAQARYIEERQKSQASEVTEEECQQLVKYKFMRHFVVDAGVPGAAANADVRPSIPYKRYKQMEHRLPTLYFIAAALRATSGELVSRETERMRGLFVEQWSTVCARVRVVQKLLDAWDTAQPPVRECLAVGAPLGLTEPLVKRAAGVLFDELDTLRSLGVHVDKVHVRRDGAAFARSGLLVVLGQVLKWVGRGLFAKRDQKGRLPRGHAHLYEFDVNHPRAAALEAQWDRDPVREFIKDFVAFTPFDFRQEEEEGEGGGAI